MRQNIAFSVTSSLFLLLQIPFTATAQISPEKRLVLTSKPSVVRVSAGCTGTYQYSEFFKDGSSRVTDYPLLSGGSGSGFFINSDGYIVTNAHVVSSVEKGEKGCKDRLFYNLVKKITGGENPDNVSQDRKSKIEDRSELKDFVYYQDVILFNGSDSNTFKFDIKKLGKPIDDSNTGEGGNKDVAVIKIGMKNTPALLLLKDPDTVQYQDKVTIIGYPGVANISRESLSEASVMGNNVANPNKIQPDGTPLIQLNQTVPRGSSGGPVLNEEAEVIGITAFSISRRESNSEDEVAFSVPASIVKEFIGPAGTTNQVGTVDTLYQQGLELYSQGKYREAKIKFDAVKALFKYHSEIDRLILDCTKYLANDSVNPSYLFWTAIAGTIALVLALIFFLIRQKPAQRIQTNVPEGMNFPDVSEQSNEDHKGRHSVNNLVSGVFRRTVLSAPIWVELMNSQGNTLKYSLSKNEHRLGRDRKWADLKIPDEGWGVISRKQAVLQRKGDAYCILDGDGEGTESTNRIYLGDSPISSSSSLMLKNGMRLRIGDIPENQVILTYSDSGKQNQVESRTDVSRR